MNDLTPQQWASHYLSEARLYLTHADAMLEGIPPVAERDRVLIYLADSIQKLIWAVEGLAGEEQSERILRS